MRLSVRVNDPGNFLYAAMGRLGSEVRIKLDGAEVDNVITADEEEGFITRYKRDEDGRLLIDGDHAAEDTVHGKVEIIAPAGYRN